MIIPSKDAFTLNSASTMTMNKAISNVKDNPMSTLESSFSETLHVSSTSLDASANNASVSVSLENEESQNAPRLDSEEKPNEPDEVKVEEKPLPELDAFIRRVAPTLYLSIFLRAQFKGACNDEDCDLPFVRDFEAARKLFLDKDGKKMKVFVYPLTKCWISQTELHREVAALKFGPLDRLFNTSSHENVDSYVVRHSLVCELIRSVPGDHIHCCRPSHLFLGSSWDNRWDEKVRKFVEQTNDFPDLGHVIAEIMKKEAMKQQIDTMRESFKDKTTTNKSSIDP
ncbi:unnamed protein product [Sphagnum jensenii]|uniref:Uncharacterized protein n=2 Tax=Sphagnum jensenii TaxID=128206 RepID=A0ABP0VJ76_9BRYO